MSISLYGDERDGFGRTDRTSVDRGRGKSTRYNRNTQKCGCNETRYNTSPYAHVYSLPQIIFYI
jgi:hypothetical protein